MSKLLLAISIFIASVACSQGATDSLLYRSDSMREEIRKRTARSDSIRNKEEIDRMTSNSVQAIVRYQQEQKEKQKKKAMLYIGIGVFFLIVLIVGLRRKVKK